MGCCLCARRQPLPSQCGQGTLSSEFSNLLLQASGAVEGTIRSAQLQNQVRMISQALQRCELDVTQLGLEFQVRATQIQTLCFTDPG